MEEQLQQERKYYLLKISICLAAAYMMIPFAIIFASPLYLVTLIFYGEPSYLEKKNGDGVFSP